MTAPVKNTTVHSPVPLKVLDNAAVYSVLLSPIAAHILKTPKPIFVAGGLMATALATTHCWKVYQDHKPIPKPKTS